MRKSFLISILVLSVGVIFGGCGNTKDNAGSASSEKNTTQEIITETSDTVNETVADETADAGDGVSKDNKISGKLKDMDFTINGTKITLPCTYEDMKKAGFDFSEEKESGYQLNPYYVSSGVSFVNEQNQSIVVTFINETDDILSYKDSPINYVSASMLTNNNPDIVLSNGVTFGSGYDAVKTNMGEPHYSYDGDGNDFRSLEYYLDGETAESGSIKFNFKENKITEITLSK